MEHKFLKELKKGQFVDCVYYVNYKISNIKRQLTDPHICKNGTKYIILKVKDNSLGKDPKNGNDIYAAVLYYYNNDAELDFLLKEETKYLKISGKCISSFPKVGLSSNSIVLANSESGIVFDTSNIFSYNKVFEKELLSVNGKSNVPLRHTSCANFQENVVYMVEKGTRLSYKRVYDSPYDKFQINVFIDDTDDIFNIPAYLSPTMARMIDNDNVEFEIIVESILENDDETFNKGIRLTIKGRKR